MKKHVIGLIALMVSCLMPWTVQAAPAADTTSAVVLPFQVNAGAGQQKLATELPDLVRQRLRDKGVKVMSAADTQRLVQRQKVGTLDVNTVRKLAFTGKSDFAVYGSLTQTGDSFSLDLRVVDAQGGLDARPYYAQRDGMINLLPAVDALVGQVLQDLSVKGGINDIRVQGLKVLDKDVVLMRLNLRKGDRLDPLTLNSEIKRIWDLGYFSDVQAHVEKDGQGVALVFDVVEKPRIDDVVVNGSDAVSKEDIIAAMSSRTGSVLNDKFLAQDIQKVTDLYRKEGYYLADVNARVEERANGASALLVFDVKEGKKLYIKAVNIEGLDKMDADDIRKTLALAERGILSWFTGTGVLREEHLDRDSQAIMAYCLNHGYIDAQVAAPEVTYEDDGIVITFKVNEGKQYKVGSIGFEGDLLDTDKKMLEVINIDEHKSDNGYFSLAVMQDDLKKLTDYYSDYGYAFAGVDVQTPKNEADSTVDILYTFNKKDKVHVRRVSVEGNTRTRDNVILREMRLADGDQFDGSKLRRSNERLNRLRYFTKADVEVQPTENPDEVDLKVKVEDDRTGAITGGVGYSTYYDFGVSGSIQERNLFGRGYQLALSGFVSGKSSSLDLTFTNPRIYDTNLGFTNSTYALWDEWDDFSKRTVGNTISFFYPIGEYTTVAAGYRLDNYYLYDVPEDAPHSYKDYLGDNISSVVHARLTYDSTNSRERPTKGYVARLFAEYGGGGLGGNDNFFRPVAELQGFHSLSNSGNHVVHWRGRMGGVFENSSKDVPVFDRFFIGGMDSIRGYSMSDLAPRDPQYGDQIGGDRMGFINLEYIWTFHPELGLALVPFYDVGYQIDSKQTSDMFDDLKQSAGLELRWRSPMGDLRFAYGFPLSKNVEGKRNKSGRFEFSMGQFF